MAFFHKNIKKILFNKKQYIRIKSKQTQQQNICKMYPRLHPKTNNFCAKVKNSLNIIEDDHKKNAVSQRTNSYLDDDMKANKFFKVKTFMDQSQKEQTQPRLNRFSSKENSQFTSKENSRQSSYLHQLPQKFNHLRGKRRSLQMALMLYQQIQDQKCDPTIDYAELTKRKNSNLKFSHSSSKKKPSFYRLGFTKMLDDSNQNIQKNEVSLRFKNQFKQPLGQIGDHEKNKLKGQNEEYNFIGKSLRKKSFFKNKILEQILQNNIDEWQYEAVNDQNEMFPKC